METAPVLTLLLCSSLWQFEAWLARKPPVSVTLGEKKSSYPQDSLLEESRRQQDEGWDARLTFND